MSPNPRDDAQLGVQHTPHRVLLILRREVEVLFCGHHDCPGLDGGEGLAGILASYGGMEVIAEVPNDGEALRLAGELSPDVVKETLRAMRSFSDPPKVVIVTMFESPQYVRGLTGVGASAYLLKTSSSEHLVAAARAAVLDPASENAVVGMPRSMLEGAEEGIDSVLSVRELEILLLAARGLSNHQISSSVYLAEGTVKRHLANVYQKMGVGSRGEASREALLREWITIEDLTAEEHGQADSPSEQG